MLCVSDLDIGNVLLFPIDDKQSRLDGQDQVWFFLNETHDALRLHKTVLPGHARLFHGRSCLFAVEVINSRVYVWLQDCEVVAASEETDWS